MDNVIVHNENKATNLKNLHNAALTHLTVSYCQVTMNAYEQLQETQRIKSSKN